jgi:hypothetical protein
LEADPVAPYLAARRIAFAKIQDIRQRTDEWLQSLDVNNVELTAIMHIEGLNAGRNKAVEDLQAAEREMIAVLTARIKHHP